MKNFLIESFRVIATFVISATLFVGLMMTMAHLESRSQGKPSYQMIHNCRYLGKVWSGEEEIHQGRGSYNVYFKFKQKWTCDNGPYFEYTTEHITPAELVKGLETGRFKRDK